MALSDQQRRVVACLAFRNAGQYLEEWLRFHLKAGVTHFYLYNNDSTDSFRSLLEPYLRRGLVRLIEWPGYYQQNAIYNHALSLGRQEGVDWMAFIDDDEFLYDVQGQPLHEVLEAYRRFGGVAVAWKIFGSSGLIYKEDKPVVERFIRRARFWDHHHKCIVRPAVTPEVITAGHFMAMAPGSTLVDQAGQPVAGPRAETPVEGRLQLNHYLIKSMQELVVRRSGRDIGTGDRLKCALEEWIKNDRTWNVVEDTTAQAVWRKEERVAEWPAPAGVC